MPLPSFLLAGAPRAGTTLLYQVCAEHPAIFMARPLAPEPKFFLVDEVYEKGLDWYVETYFADVGDALAWGEKSTNYLESPVAAARIGADLPEVRLVFVLRDPVERAFSNYLWSRKNGLETDSFADALAAEPEREAAYQGKWRYARPYSYRSRGRYVELLQPYLERFPREQIHVLFLEELRADPARMLGELFAFLGVPPLPTTPELPSGVNTARAGGENMSQVVRAALEAYYREPNQELAAALGRELPAAWAGEGGAPR
jgi:hypothetical protein